MCQWKVKKKHKPYINNIDNIINKGANGRLKRRHYINNIDNIINNIDNIINKGANGRLKRLDNIINNIDNIINKGKPMDNIIKSQWKNTLYKNIDNI